MPTILEEVKEITANEVAKKQEAAKMNFPNILEKIKAQAKLGLSSCTISTTEMNEYDKNCLIAEGFIVSLIDKHIDRYNAMAQYNPSEQKIWQIKW